MIEPNTTTMVANKTILVPTLSHLLGQYTQATNACLAHPAHCLLSGSMLPENVGSLGGSFTLLGIGIIVLLGIVSFFIIRTQFSVTENVAVISPEKIEPKKEVKAPKNQAVKQSTKMTTFKPERAKSTTAVASSSKNNASSKRSDDMSALSGSPDVVATKLDLARVYVEMGSAREAKKLLGQVISAGDEAQRAAAEILIKKLTTTEVVT